mgnify:CR=1 FL=1
MDIFPKYFIEFGAGRPSISGVLFDSIRFRLSTNSSANKLTIFFFCLTISHFDIARDVSTATASLLQAMSIDLRTEFFQFQII